jgi:hypothetical protein
MSRSTTEKDEIDGLAGNLYLTLVSFRPGFKSVEIMGALQSDDHLDVARGRALVLLGVVFAVWPESQPYPVFAAARRRAKADAPALDPGDAVPDPGASARSHHCRLYLRVTVFLFFAIVAALVTLYLLGRTLAPLTDRSVLTAADLTRVEDESADLLAQRDRLIGELKDLEVEAAMNKIDPNDLSRLRARFESEALEVVRRMDERAAAYADRLGQTKSGRDETAAEVP